MDQYLHGTKRPSFRRPVVVLGTEATMLGRPLVSPVQAAQEGFTAIDLDLRASWHSDALGPLQSWPTSRMRSVWIPRQYTGPLHEARADQLRTMLSQAVQHYGLRTVVVPAADGQSQRGTSLGHLARSLTALGGVRLALRIGPETLLNRAESHLDIVANYRRMAEEWDLDLALDLTHSDIGAWEAEATLMRIFPRLTVVRVRPLVLEDGTPADAVPARIGMRTMSMLADQAYSGLVSIAPEFVFPARMLRFPTPSLDPAMATRELIRATYDRIDAYDITMREKRQQPG